MSTFLLVHGAWHGGWCWERVVVRLRSAGHQVFSPTLTGLAERRHLVEHADLETHVLDLVNLVAWHDARDVVVCAHSYGGLPATGAVDRLGDRVSAMVYLDAFVPSDGQNGATMAGIPSPGGLTMDAPPAVSFGLTGMDAKLVDARMTPHPAASARQPLRLSGALAIPRTFVRATGWSGPDVFRSHYEDARSSADWTAWEIDGSHDLMIDRPEEVGQILLKAAEQGNA